MDLSTPEKLFSSVRTTPLEELVSAVEKDYDYEQCYERYRDARLDRLWKDGKITLYVWYRFFSTNKRIAQILLTLFPRRFADGYFDARPFEYVFKNLLPAPYGEQSDAPPSFRDAISEIKDHIDDYERVYERLADDLSKHTLYIILRARLTRDPSLFITEEVYVSREEACFDTTLYSLPPQSVYVDCGGYNGDTVRLFVKIFKRYKRIYVFEPDPLIAPQLAHNIGTLHDVVIEEKGVSDHVTEASFLQSGGGVGRLSSPNEGGATVPLTTLDAAVPEPISLIKMDIEGAEDAALRGASTHINHDRPILAINAYHKLGDIRNLMKTIEDAGEGYTFYLRHYCYIYIKTVLYAIPHNPDL